VPRLRAGGTLKNASLIWMLGGIEALQNTSCHDVPVPHARFASGEDEVRGYTSHISGITLS
jgi:hypothetical protein